MRRRLVSIGLVAAALAAGGCGKKDAPAPSASESAPIPATEAAAPAESGAAAPTAATGTWTPEALEELLAPIAIYPDVVLGHVLSASTNPQEVLDAGNWLLEHQDLTGSALDEEAEKLGFSPSMRALLQFPEAVDMMCMRMDWTTQLGQAFTADQGAVLDAVQRHDQRRHGGEGGLGAEARRALAQGGQPEQQRREREALVGPRHLFEVGVGAEEGDQRQTAPSFMRSGPGSSP